MDYNEENELINNRVELYDSKTGKKGFDVRSVKELEVANMIEEKNKMIDENGKGIVKRNKNGGFVSALVLSLLSGFTLVVITTLTYIAIK